MLYRKIEIIEDQSCKKEILVVSCMYSKQFDDHNIKITLVNRYIYNCVYLYKTIFYTS